MRLTSDFLQQTAGSLGLPLSMYLRFLAAFPQDLTAQTLCSAVLARDAKAALCAAHTLKGYCAQLGLQELSDTANALCCALRFQPLPDWELISRYAEALRLIHAQLVCEIQCLPSA